MELADKIVNMMASELTGEQLRKLREVVVMALAEDNQCTELSTKLDDNVEYLKKYMVEMKVQQKSDGTIRQYMYAVKNFLTTVGKNFRDVTSDDVILYFAKLQTQQKKPVHLDNLRRYVKTFFNYLVETDVITRNPFYRMKPIRKPQHQKVTLSDTEVEKMRDACGNVYDRALLDFLLSTGCRVGEVSRLSWDNFDLEHGTCKIYATKTREWRTVYLDAKAINHMQALKKTNRKKVFGKCKAILEKHVRNLASAGGIEKHVTVHTFRRTFASRLFSRGMDIMMIAKILGHRTTATTMQYYISINEEQAKTEFNRVA